MRILLILFFCFYLIPSFAQDSAMIAKINSIVSKINSSNLPEQNDSVVQDFSGLKMVTHLTMVADGNQLLKYVNEVVSTRTDNGAISAMITCNTFYYNGNKLIKVEEYAINGDKKQVADWYYWEEKPVYYTVKNDKSVDRAALLQSISQAIVKKVIK